MWAELSVNHFYYSNHWERALKIIFKGSGCFQFPEAVVTSKVKEAYAIVIAVHYKFSLFHRSSNCGEQL